MIASDFYNGIEIAGLSDQAIVDCLMQELLPLAVPARLVDQEVRAIGFGVLFRRAASVRRWKLHWHRCVLATA